MTSSIKIKSYKCFKGEIAQGFEEIKPINIVIGKNNSGKSSLLDLVGFNINTSPPNNSALIVEDTIQEDDIGDLGSGRNIGHDIPDLDANVYLKGFIGKNICFQITNTGKTIISPEYSTHVGIFFRDIVDRIHNRRRFANKTIRKVNAERDIQPEEQSKGDAVKQLNGNGDFSTQLLRQLFHETAIGSIRETKDSHILKKEFFEKLNSIIQPDINFLDITVKQQSGTQKWEIYFETATDNFIPLSKMGSGMKTIILVLLNLIIEPKVDGKSENDYIFILEELENNLHPAMQRRLYNFIIDFSERNKGCFFFISTHSNIVIDAFSRHSDSQILHITNEQGISTVKTILNQQDQKNLLQELDYRASDILQTNGIIWVEGPSDRIYLNKWLSLTYPELKEGTHYSIMFYGGRLLSHLSFKNIQATELNNLIEILKINQNVYIMIDKDGEGLNENLNQTKIRIHDEVGPNKCWITDGIEIENYISGTTLSNWLSDKYECKDSINFNDNDKIDTIIPSSAGVKYSSKKVQYSHEIIDFIELTDIENNSKLKQKIQEVGETIKKWNQ